MNGDRNSQDAIISIESTAEWQVHDILYDGQERYVAPLTFADYVAKYARKVDWRKLVGAETSADDYTEDEEDEETNVDAVQTQNQRQQQSQAQASVDNELQKLLTGSSSLKEKIGEDHQNDGEKSRGGGEEMDEWPGTASKSFGQDQEVDGGGGGETSQQGVGPWDAVAKRLLQSLTEMNVLLDAIQVARNGKYLVLDPVQQEPLEHLKNAQLAAKKKALTSASAVLLSLADQMRSKSVVTSSTGQQQLDSDLEELMEMRKNWRLKKVGNTIVGDLSYFSVGKYRPNATFEVKKVEKRETATSYGIPGSPIASKSPSSTRRQQTWEVMLPKDLDEALRLCVVIEAPDGGVAERANFFGKKPHPKISINAGWQEKLELAQRTLFCRDLFAQLAREAAHIPDLCCAIRGRAIIVKLPYGHALTISLNQFSPESQEPEQESTSKDERAFVLEHNLQQLFDDELEGANEVIIPRPVAAPLTHLSKKARLAGPDALSTHVLSSESDSDKMLIQRLLDQTLHFLLYQRCKSTVDEFAATCRDPMVSVHWCPETTGVWSMLRIQMMTPFYEFCGKTLLMLEVQIHNIKATLRDGEVVTLSSNLDELTHFLKLRARQHIISAVGTLCRPHQWQTLYSNPCEADEDGNLAPAILVGHPAGASAICVKYPLNGDPIIFVQSSSDGKISAKGDLFSYEDNNSGGRHQLWSYLRNTLRLVDYAQLPGNNFLHKIELLVATLT